MCLQWVAGSNGSGCPEAFHLHFCHVPILFVSILFVGLVVENKILLLQIHISLVMHYLIIIIIIIIITTTIIIIVITISPL